MKKATSLSASASKGDQASNTKSKRKPATKKTAPGNQTDAPKETTKAPAVPTLRERIAEAKKLEAVDRAKASGAATSKTPPRNKKLALAEVSATHPFRNTDFPETYIQQISVKLDDPDHPVILTWTGPQAAAQESGPFRSSPGAELRRSSHEPALRQQVYSQGNFCRFRIPRQFEQ
jgi:hypothetical protein